MLYPWKSDGYYELERSSEKESTRGQVGHWVKSVDEDTREKVIRMAKISLELRSGTACFAVAVQAPTIQRALNIAATRYPGSRVRMKPPIAQTGSSVEDRVT